MNISEKIRIEMPNGDMWEISKEGRSLRLCKNAIIIAYAHDDEFSTNLFIEAINHLFEKILLDVKLSFP